MLSVRSHFWDIATMRRKDWLTVRLIIINCLETCVSCAIKSLQEMVILLFCSQFHGIMLLRTLLNHLVFYFSVFTALNKAWCVHHFACSVCDQKMNQKTKFYECDLKPVCKKCYEKYPAELRRRLRKTHEATPKKATV